MNDVLFVSNAKMINAVYDILELLCEIKPDPRNEPIIAEFEEKALELVQHAIMLQKQIH